MLCLYGSGLMLPACLAELPVLPCPEKPRHNRGRRFPILRLALQLLPSRARQAIELCLAIIVRDAPLRRDRAFLLQLDQRRIQRAVIHLKLVAAGLLDAAGNSIPVQRPHGVQRLHHHQRQRPLPNVCFIAQMPSYGYPIATAVCYMGRPYELSNDLDGTSGKWLGKPGTYSQGCESEIFYSRSNQGRQLTGC